jgi:hypothetical protein
VNESETDIPMNDSTLDATKWDNKTSIIQKQTKRTATIPEIQSAKAIMVESSIK